MAKAKMLGMRKGYTPNSKDDMRYRKKIYQRGRESAFHPQKESINDHEICRKNQSKENEVL